MNYFSKRFRATIVAISFTLFPFTIFAQTGNQTCSPRGYTIETINGVFTSDAGAKENKENLKKRLPGIFNNEPLTVDYLLNPSHLGGIGDILTSVYQKAFENETVQDYDLIEMLNDASQRVKTQKLLLVAHSQGNFYANSFYDTVVDKVGGVSAQSIGVYSVANPASRVAGGGKWVTSDTDKVIAGVVARVPFKKIMPPNTHIELQSGDDAAGHDFSEIYLKYRSSEIVTGVQSSLDNLSINPERREGTLCIDPPKITIAHKVAGVALAIADPVATVGVKTVATTAKAGIFVAVTTVKAGVTATVWTYHTAVAATVWTYHAGVAIVKTVGNIAVATASTLYAAAETVISDTRNFAGSNSASVILALNKNPQPVSIPKTQGVVAPANVITPATPLVRQATPRSVVVPAITPVPSQDEKQTAKTPSVKLVFVGNLSPGLGGGGGGSSPASQVLGSTTETPEVPQENIPDVIPEIPVVPKHLSAPVLVVPQCAYSLATSTESCLLATTNVRVEWNEVPDASYYTINKNGVYATTTSVTLDVVAPDFSNYTFEVAAVGTSGQTSATSTKTISIATIPIAINEVAWMGTAADTSDEWLELKNNTAHTIDLSQWALEAKDGKPYIKLSGIINPREYIVFERTNDTTIKDVLAHGVYTGALNDAGDQISLSYASTTLDKTPDGKWAAGTTTARQTMERYASKELGTDPANWGTNLGYVKNGIDAKGNSINGTPGAQNSVSTLINKGQDITSNFTVTSDEERYIVPDSMFVAATTTLVIEPGVTISFLSDNQGHDGSFNVQGAVDARGTVESPIMFNSFLGNQTGGFWFGNSTGASTFDHVSFENTEGVGVDNAALNVRNADFIHSDGGINAYEKSTVIIENTKFASSTDDTIGAYGGSVIYIASSTVANQLDGDAIGIYDGSSLFVASTTIDGVKDGDGIGIYDSIFTIASSTIKNVSDNGIGLYNSTSTISNTVIANGGGDGIGVFGGEATIVDTIVSGFVDGSGVTVSAPAEPVTITGGEITGNDIGVSMDADSVILSDVSMSNNAQDVIIFP